MNSAPQEETQVFIEAVIANKLSADKIILHPADPHRLVQHGSFAIGKLKFDFQFMAGCDPVLPEDAKAHAAARDVVDADDSAVRPGGVGEDVGSSQVGWFAVVAAKIEQHPVDMVASTAYRQGVAIVEEFRHGYLSRLPTGRTNQSGGVVVTNVDFQSAFGHHIEIILKENSLSFWVVSYYGPSVGPRIPERVKFAYGW